MPNEAFQVWWEGDRGSKASKALQPSNIICWSILVILFVVAIILAAVYAGPPGSSAQAPVPAPTPSPGSLVPNATINSSRGCQDPSVYRQAAVNFFKSLGADYQNNPRQVVSDGGVVASDTYACSAVGVETLKAGGNAVDAAIAAALCSGIVNPQSSGVGGGHFMNIRWANGSSETIIAREQAPGNASSTMYQGMLANASLYGGLAVGIPLDLKGLRLAWQRWGQLPWSRLVQPAAKMARYGINATPYLVYDMTDKATTFYRLLAYKGTREAFMVYDSNNSCWRPPAVGELCCKRPQLANTLDRIANEGIDWLYTGGVAAKLAQEIQAAGGIVTAEDLKKGQAVVKPATLVNYGNWSFQVVPPPSSGSLVPFLFQFMAGFNQTSYNPTWLKWHRQVEAYKNAFAMRMVFGDPDVPLGNAMEAEALKQMSNATFIDGLRSLVNDSHVLNLTQYGGPFNLLANAPDDQGTCHLGVVDAAGNAVAMTNTINDLFGSFVMSESTGILLNNEMDDFSKPDSPNTYDLHPSTANYIAPYKRPLSSMSPTIVTENGQLRVVVGASNGPRIITSVTNALLEVLLYNKTALAAISEPRVHAQLLPDLVRFENITRGGIIIQVPDEELQYLGERGNTLLVEQKYLGVCQVIVVDPVTGRRTAVSDPRKDGAPAGY